MSFVEHHEPTLPPGDRPRARRRQIRLMGEVLLDGDEEILVRCMTGESRWKRLYGIGPLAGKRNEQVFEECRVE